MKNTYTISLENISFFGYHGLYDFEKKNGNDFLVNITIKYKVSTFKIVSITDILDYSKVYEVISSAMQVPTELLENLCTDITNQLMQTFECVQKVDISISKLNPPIGGKCEKSTVSYSEKR